MIDKLLRAKAVVGIAAAVLLASGVAYAASDGGSRPAVSQDEVSSTSSSVDQSSTSTSMDDSSTSSTTVDTDSTSTTQAPNGSTTTTDPEAEHEHPENHGACVSQAAHDTPPGPDHGKTVSSVAQSDCGKNTTATSEPNENENENEAPEQENEQHGSQSGDHGSSGGDHGNSGHGGPGQD